MTGLVSWSPARCGGAGLGPGQDARVPESHRRPEGPRVPQHTDRQNEALRALSCLYRETVRKTNTTIVPSRLHLTIKVTGCGGKKMVLSIIQSPKITLISVRFCIISYTTVHFNITLS